MKNIDLSREVGGFSHILILGLSYIVLDSLQSLIIYSSSYYNHDAYPLSLTTIVAATELTKLLVFIIVLQFQGLLFKIQLSPKFAVPSFVYAIINNLHYLALIYTTPPIWTALMQLRLVLTAVIYRILFKKNIRFVQFIGLILLSTGVLLSTIPNNNADISRENSNYLIASTLALLAAALSSAGSVYMEFLFKNNRRSFSEMQLQFYFFGSLFSTGISIMNVGNTKKHPLDWVVFDTKLDNFLKILIVLAIFLGVIIGTIVALVIKQLDNVVKIYVQNVGNLVVSVLFTIIFPERFTISMTFCVGFILIVLGIWMYEKFNLHAKKLENIEESSIVIEMNT